MNNFFYDATDFSSFKKAMKNTKNEPIVINILSTDPSLSNNTDQVKNKAVHKKFSDKFAPSPFGKFFGPRKQRTAPVDMIDFSSWKNKNYRDTEKNLDKNISSDANISISDFLNKNSNKNKYNELDEAKSNLQKSINQLSSDDPVYKKFELDSFMNKLEEQTNVNDEFKQNDDILAPLEGVDNNVVADSTQDENFGESSNIAIERFAFDDRLSGDEYKFDKEELDKIKSRLDRMENDSKKEKTNEKVISSELSDLTKDEEDDDFDFSKLGQDDIDDELVDDSIANKNINEKEQEQGEHKTFFEINKSDSLLEKEAKQQIGQSEEKEIEETDSSLTSNKTDDNIADSKDQDSSIDESQNSIDDNVIDTYGENFDESNNQLDYNQEGIDDNQNYVDDISQQDENIDQSYDENQLGDSQNTGALTKAEFAEITDNLVQKFAELYKKDENYAEENNVVSQSDLDAQYAQQQAQQQAYDYQQYAEKQNELQSKILELIEKNKQTDLQVEEKLKQVELEKEQTKQDYENKIKEIEDNYKKSYEAFKQKVYLEKLDNDMKFKNAEKEFKKREKRLIEDEMDWSQKQKIGEFLRKELKSNLSISNLEMEKRLLEKISKNNKKSMKKLAEDVEEKSKKLDEKISEEKIEEKEEKVEDNKVEKKKESSKSSTKKSSTSSKSRTSGKRRTSAPRKKRRKIDSDIIGGIDFE